MFTYFIYLILLSLVYFLLLFIIGSTIKRDDILDVGWGIGFIVISFFSKLYFKDTSLVGNILLVLITIWGVRLSYHIFQRIKRHGEDVRYINLKKDFIKFVSIKRFLKLYLPQNILMLLIASPIILFFHFQNNTYNKSLSAIGIIVWLIGYIFEVIGDYQLSEFIKNNKEKNNILKSGLWKYTRHPNYFGEITMWWGIFIITLVSYTSLLGIVGPVGISYLILKVSGIPMNENLFTGNDEYEKYKKTTSKFFPLPPKDLSAKLKQSRL